MSTQNCPHVAPPQIKSVERDKIPDFLKSIRRWVVWKAGPAKANGKFDKAPCDPVSSRKINGLDPGNWLTYQDALAAYDNGGGGGIGIVLSDKHPVTLNGTDFYLVALDFDNCSSSMNEIKELWLRLGKPYIEASPSGKGIRIFALSTTSFKGGNAGGGREMYSSGRFMTVTGVAGKGTVKDATSILTAIDQSWFGAKPKPEAQSRQSSSLLEETASNVQPVLVALDCVSSDIDYETWRNIVWAILSTGWHCAKFIARKWSKRALHRYDEDAFQALVNSFDPDKGITLRTLFHHAKLNGWKPAGSTDDEAEEGIWVRQEKANPSNRLLTAEEVKALPNTPYRVKGVLPAKGVAAIYGESGSGKSFLAIDLALAIAAGSPKWFHLPSKQAPVVYIALEGRGGISKRIKAREQHYKEAASPHVRFLLGDFQLLEPKDVTVLAPQILEAVGSNAVVVVDTLNQSAPGADENSSGDMGRILSNAKRLADQVDGLVILIHHLGKDRSKGMRGHSSLVAAMDATIEVTRSHEGRAWTVAKAKDDEDGIRRDFELVPYVVDTDEDGHEVTSAAVRPTLKALSVKAKPLTGKHQIPAMAKLSQVLRQNPGGISRKIAVQEVAAVLDCGRSRATTVAKTTIDNLIRGGHLYNDDENEGVINSYEINHRNPAENRSP